MQAKNTKAFGKSTVSKKDKEHATVQKQKLKIIFIGKKILGFNLLNKIIVLDFINHKTCQPTYLTLNQLT